MTVMRTFVRLVREDWLPGRGREEAIVEIWVQERLFEVTGPKPRGKVDRREWPRVVGWSPVTRDPAVAASYAEGARLASDIRVGLARALDRLSPEQRQAIRASVGPGRRQPAA